MRALLAAQAMGLLLCLIAALSRSFVISGRSRAAGVSLLQRGDSIVHFWSLRQAAHHTSIALKVESNRKQMAELVRCATAVMLCKQADKPVDLKRARLEKDVLEGMLFRLFERQEHLELWPAAAGNGPAGCVAEGTLLN